MLKVHKAHKLGAIKSGEPRWGASLRRISCHINNMLVASPARMQMIQAGQNEPCRLSIGSQAVSSNGAVKPVALLVSVTIGFMAILHHRKKTNLFFSR
jgi:hypothetical protein